MDGLVAISHTGNPLEQEKLDKKILHLVVFVVQCHALVDPAEYVAQCEEELCVWNTTDACPALESYAADCRRQGVCLQWRADLCPSPWSVHHLIL